MSGQSSRTRAKTEMGGEEVKNEILSSKPANRRPASDGKQNSQSEHGNEQPDNGNEQPDNTDEPANVDRPGFDLGGSTGNTRAGKGLGLGEDAKTDKKEWGLPR